MDRDDALRQLIGIANVSPPSHRKSLEAIWRTLSGEDSELPADPYDRAEWAARQAESRLTGTADDVAWTRALVYAQLAVAAQGATNVIYGVNETPFPPLDDEPASDVTPSLAKPGLDVEGAAEAERIARDAAAAAKKVKRAARPAVEPS